MAETPRRRAEGEGGPHETVESRMRGTWLSVVMPTYNGAAYLDHALASLRAQDGNLGGVEIIAVDDGSTDGTVEALRAAGRDLPLRVVRRPHTGNWVAGANLGLSLACGNYVGFLHQDDYWLPHRLRTLRGLTAAFSDAPLVVHPSLYVDQAGRTVGRLRCPLKAGRGGGATRVSPDVMVGRLLVQNFVAMPGHLVRRDATLRVGGLDEELWYAADWDLWLKLSALGGALYTPQPLTACRVHLASQTMSRGGRDLGPQLHAVLDRHLPVWSTYPAALTRGGAAIPRAARLSAEVNRFLARGSGGRPREAAVLLAHLAGLGFAGWWSFLRYSRVAERAVARLKAGLWGPFRNPRSRPPRVHAARSPFPTQRVRP